MESPFSTLDRSVVTAVTIEEVCGRLMAVRAGAVVALEGFCGSGKTTLAGQVGKRVQMNVFHVDSFARKFDRPPAYTECLDLVRLHHALNGRAQTRPSIVEGICLRDVLLLVGIIPTTFIYLKRVGKNGLWYDGLNLMDFEEGHPAPGDSEEPHRSDLGYHRRVRPHETADVVYERVMDD
ncbi:MAG: hypothetical protein R3F45_15055 [Gammaproteobacteria bacterium]